MRRLIGVITIINNIAVQSFGYNKYLPLGKPEILAKNLDRWGVDEILLNVIDRSKRKLAPDFRLLELVKRQKISTPIIYGGGINSLDNAKKVINDGADRIIIESLLINNFDEVKKISNFIGSQSLIISIPLCVRNNRILQFNYLNKKKENINKNFLEVLKHNYASEALLIDYNNEGSKDGFDLSIIDKFPIQNKSLIVFGGISSNKKIKKIFKSKIIGAAAIGNSLNYSEHREQNIKIKNQQYFRI